MAMDLFCSADDRHRVILLVDLMKRAGQTVELRCEPVAEPSSPSIVACSRRALREPWINGLFSEVATLVAIRLDDTPLPARCARVIDMQAWPARSADRKVGSLVRWLQHGDEVPSRRSGVRGAAGRRHDRGDAGERPRARVRTRDRAPNLSGFLVVLVLVVVAGVLFSLAAPERGDRNQTQQDLRETAERAPAVVAPAVAPGAATPDPGMPADSGPGRVIEPVSADPSHADPSLSPDPVPVRVEDHPPPRAGGDALDHLCRARTLEAARAWAGTLSWKQRQRLPDEPCVRELLARPGFEPLRELLDLS